MDIKKALCSASKKGKTKKVLKLLQERRPTVACLNEALGIASFNGHLEIVKLLIDAGADINERTGQAGWTPLLFAIENLNKDVILYLISKGVEVNKCHDDEVFPKNYSALHHSIDIESEAYQTWNFNEDYDDFKSFEVSQLLIDAGANINCKDEKGRTPLDIAYNHPVAKRVLNKLGAKSGKYVSTEGK